MYVGYVEFKNWGVWLVCSKVCGGGKWSRNRECVLMGDILCFDDIIEEEDCNINVCVING